MAEAPYHVVHRTIVLDDLKILYVPVPKAACTSLLWLMAHLAGIPEGRFALSERPEATLSMTVHDMRVWGEGRRLADYEGEDRQRVLTEDGWFRFTVVREPGSRLWSAWQSKLLMREPRFVAMFGDEPWFPAQPRDPGRVVEDFRRFVEALGQEGAGGSVFDVHWGVQHDLLEGIGFDHIGRVERLEDTIAALRDHLGDDAAVEGPSRENRTALPYDSALYDEPSAATVQKVFGADFEHYGYEPVKPGVDGAALEEWRERAAALLPLMREMIERHERIAALHRVTRNYADERDVLARQANRARKRIRDLEQRLAKVRTERDQARDRLRRARESGRKQVEQLQRQRDALKLRLAAVHASTSWKVTKPLRFLRRINKRPG